MRRLREEKRRKSRRHSAAAGSKDELADGRKRMSPHELANTSEKRRSPEKRNMLKTFHN